MAKTVIVSTIELATFLGLTKQGLYKRGELPPADFISVGGRECWLPGTAEDWDKTYREKHGVGHPASKNGAKQEPTHLIVMG